MFSPILKRNLSRIVPFSIIWLITGWIFLFVEETAMGGENRNPSSAIELSPQVVFFASIAVIIVGFAIGFIEVVVLKNAFVNRSFFKKILLKLLMYLGFFLITITITYPVASAIEFSTSLTNAQVWQKFTNFWFSTTLLSTILQMAFSLFLCLFYSEISDNIGHGVLMNFFTGKYHQPKEEERIFMFCDMKSSTSIAEKLGHVQYFEFLQSYYNVFSKAIINHEGEVYQYIGDEIIISWKLEAGLRNDNCINCFFSMQEALESKCEDFKIKFGIVPEFKAGMHYGNVTTGEVGALKKEIIFTGDVLNTTSRIQTLCKSYDTDLLISKALFDKLTSSEANQLQVAGEVALRGKEEKMQLYRLQSKEIHHSGKAVML